MCNHFACATHSSPPAHWFHTKMGGCFAFTYIFHPWMKFLLQYNITGLNADWVTRASMTFCGGIYHVKKCRAMRGNWSEPAWAGTKVIPVSCKLPRKQFNVKRVHLWYSVALGNEIVEFLKWLKLHEPKKCRKMPNTLLDRRLFFGSIWKNKSQPLFKCLNQNQANVLKI